MSVVALRNSHTAQQVDLIRRTVAKDCNDTEFDLFCTVVRNTGLDPFRKQIYAFVYNKDDPTKRKMSIVTGIDGMRAIAARSLRYRPDEEEPVYTYDETLKGPSNPLGLVKASVRIWIRDAERPDWRPVAGVAYWDEYAPIIEESSEGYRWVETGETWADTGKPKKKKVANEGGEIIRQVDPKTQWPKMGRVMLAKCSESGALRKAFPEDLSGIYEHSEMDQAFAREETPSQMVESVRAESRLLKIGGADGIIFQLFPNAPLESIAVGQVADRVLETIRDFSSDQQMRWFESANVQPLREFWARAPGDALELKKSIEARRGELQAASA